MNTFEWCGYNWLCKMEGYRIIHKKQPWQWYSLDTIKIDKNNTLELFIKKNPKEIKFDGEIFNPPYEVSTMRTKEDFSYGTFSAEIMVPKGRNLSASFWLTGSGNWPPEIDIMEGFLGNSGDWFKCFQKHFPWIRLGWTTTNNVVYRNEQMNQTHIGSENVPYTKQTKDPSENWIEYKCVWKPDRITFYANNKVVRDVTGYICQQLTKNIENPEKGFKMNAIFNAWTENPDQHTIDMIQPMLVRNFKYTPYEKEQ